MNRKLISTLRYITWKSLLLKIIISTIIDSWQRIKRVKFITGSLGSVVAFFLLFKNLFGYSREESISFAIKIILYYLFVVLLYSVIKNAIKYIQKWAEMAEWGEAIIVLSDVRRRIHHVTENPYVDQVYKDDLRKICNTIKRYFDYRTDSDCSVSIKVATGDGSSIENIILVNLVRDEMHKSRDTDQYINTKHTIIANTPFSYISGKMSSGKLACYINNNISNTSTYLNSSKSTYPDGILPYSSEFVVAIVPLGSYESSVPRTAAGFLCVDSNKIDSFQDTKYDKSFLMQIADILSSVIK